MALRRPSLKTINLYNELVEKQNKVRKTLLRLHKQAEETHGAGRLPALVVPKRARKLRQADFTNMSKLRLKQFWARYKEAKNLFGKGLKSYIARTVKQGYMELWRDQILFMSGESPEGYFNLFSKEQIEGSYMGEFMEVYNMLNRLSPEVFLSMLYSGKIISFKYIYQDMISGTGEKENSWLQQQAELLALYRSPKAKAELLEEMRDFFGKHTEKTFSKAEKAKKDEEERQAYNQRKAEQAKKAQNTKKKVGGRK